MHLEISMESDGRDLSGDNQSKLLVYRCSDNCTPGIMRDAQLGEENPDVDGSLKSPPFSFFFF